MILISSLTDFAQALWEGSASMFTNTRGLESKETAYLNPWGRLVKLSVFNPN